MAWIFQDIEDIKDKTLRAGKVLHQIEEYNKQLREKVDPQIYTKYCIWQCDVYVDAYGIGIAVNHVYPHITIEQAVDWALQFKEPNQLIV